MDSYPIDTNGSFACCCSGYVGVVDGIMLLSVSVIGFHQGFQGKCFPAPCWACEENLNGFSFSTRECVEAMNYFQKELQLLRVG